MLCDRKKFWYLQFEQKMKHFQLFPFFPWKKNIEKTAAQQSALLMS